MIARALDGSTADTEARSEPPASTEVATLAPTEGAMLALRVVGLDEEARTATLAAGARTVDAALDDALDVAVVRGAIARGERLVVQREGGGLVVLGALRTAATPGLEPCDDVVIEANRLRVRAAHEVSIAAGTSAIALRAIGNLELLARNITARAEGVQRLFARLIELN
jgi:hypothetical protein